MLQRTRRRLTAGYVGIVAVIVVLFGAVTVFAFEQSTRRDRDRQLTQKAGALAAGNSGAVDGADFGTVVLAADGLVLERDRTAPTLGLPDRAGANLAAGRSAPVLRTVDGPDGAVRVASLRSSGGRVSQVGRSVAVDEAAAARLLRILGAVGAASLLLAGLGGLAMARRALRPVEMSFERQRAFIADASHELKTPLALIRMDAEVLSRDPSVPDAKELLGHQIEEIGRMTELLSDLLLLARMDAGKLSVDRMAFDLGDVLAESAGRFHTRATHDRIDLGVDVEGPVAARGDRRRTAQVLAALLDNAVRVTPGGGEINATARRVNGRAEVEITDTGPGIATEERERVFDRFQRAAPGQESGGSGLGLAIARDLARLQGGDLVVAPVVHGGARLRLELPAA